MRLGSKRITRDMLEAALAKQWDPTTTSRHYGVHRTSVTAACERFGILLPMHKFSPQAVSRRSSVWREAEETPKTPAKWSCKPGAIERALKEFENKRPLQARS
jgi:hypothetical protein